MIPKILHRVWIGNTPHPAGYAFNLTMFRRLHPDWEVEEWNDHNLPALRCRDEFDRLQNWVDRADLVRLEILALHGGLYLDHDVIPLKNMDELLEGGDFLARINQTNISTSVLGAVEGSSFFDEALRLFPGALMARELQTPKGYIGSPFLSEVLHKRMPDTRCVPPVAFYPLMRGAKLPDGREAAEASVQELRDLFPDSYGVHTWDSLGR